jgi:predicted alpha/beta hydrolase family esterase
MTRVLLVPGYDNSEPEHWQSLWEREHPEYERVDMPDWAQPQRDGWVDALDRAVGASDEPAVLVAHSLGCLAVAHWAAGHSGPVKAALLVAPAPADAESTDLPVDTFMPVPLTPLPFRAVVVGSQNDPYMSEERARELAGAWRAVYIDAGEAGHINVDAGHGPWPDGEQLLADLMAY